MTTRPELVHRDEQPYAAIPTRVTRRHWGDANKLIPEVRDWLAAREIQPAGAPFIRYLVIGDMDEEYTLEVGWTVDDPVAGDGRVTSQLMPAGRYATLIHHGHPDALDGSHALIEDWLASQGITAQRDDAAGEPVWAGRYEFFLTDPTGTPDPDQWQTRILYQLAG